MVEEEQRHSPQEAPDIRSRTYDLALRIVRLCRALRQDKIGAVMVNQLLRSGTAVGANVEEAQGGQSKRDFAHKMSIARKEAFETRYWLRIIRDSGCLPEERMQDIIEESEEICRILSSIVLTARRNKSNS